MRYNDSGAHRPLIRRTPDGVWRLVDRAAQPDTESPQSPAGSDAPHGFGDVAAAPAK
jgi:hypothetical protein